MLHFADASTLVTSSNNIPIRVTIADLLKNKKMWKNKKIEVIGFYRVTFEVSALYESVADSRNTKDESSLWVSYHRIKPGFENKVKWSKNKFVRIVGIFDYKTKIDSEEPAEYGCGHLGMWPAEITYLELVEETSTNDQK